LHTFYHSAELCFPKRLYLAQFPPGISGWAVVQEAEYIFQSSQGKNIIFLKISIIAVEKIHTKCTKRRSGGSKDFWASIVPKGGIGSLYKLMQ